MLEIESRIRAIPDFPKPGILYRDITPLLGDSEALALAARELAARAARRLAERYSLDRQLERLLEVYRKVQEQREAGVRR